MATCASHGDPGHCPRLASPRACSHPRDPDRHFAGGQEHERVREKPIERVGQIIQGEASRSLDMVAKPENAVDLHSERGRASPELLIARQQHGVSRRLRQRETETIVSRKPWKLSLEGEGALNLRGVEINHPKPARPQIRPIRRREIMQFRRHQRKRDHELKRQRQGGCQ